MNNKILKKYVEKEIEKYLAEKDKEYLEFLSANKPSDFPKEIAVKIEPVWNDIYNYENGGFFKRLKIKIKSAVQNRHGDINVPHDVIISLAETFLPDIRAFFESEEGKKEFEDWKEKQDSLK